MADSPARPEKFFFDKFGLDDGALQKGLGGALGRSIDYADVYFEYRVNESIQLEEGLVKKATRAINQGAGVRAQAGEKTGYGFSDEITVQNLQIAAKTARAIAEGASESAAVSVGTPNAPARNLYQVPKPATDVPVTEKVELLDRIDKLARACDPRIKNVIATVGSEQKLVMMVGSDGTYVADVQPLLRLNVVCIAEDGEKRRYGVYGGGGRLGFEWLGADRDGRPRWEHFVREAARQAILGLDAVDAPAGLMDVVLGPGWPGILLHEAIGHGLEGDFNRKKTSAFAGKLGQRVASDICTVVDDGTIADRRGSLNVDDEGTPTQRSVLIEKGILRNFMQDKLNARLMGMEPTGNGRRESYAHIPMPRMTNTFMLAGEDDPADIIRSVKRGLYAVNFGGGQVDITNGKFVFSASEAYLIEDGKVTRPVKDATLIGNGPDVLTRVSRVGNDLGLDEGVGTCGKDGQSVPVGVGLPTIRIDGITVGGTQ
ncbi:MAG: metalloprotease TldD [Deltaproteobacteria bacterium]|nr:metalloprotease TldD [Deltaproteobacteria bacterium]